MQESKNNNQMHFTEICVCFQQSQTMQMMYQVIARELKSMQLVDSHPLDYLNFYCLGNREANGQFANDADKVMSKCAHKHYMH